MGVPVYFPPTWHWAHATATWAPVKGNWVLLWSVNDAGFQAAVVWQFTQVVGKPPATWLGFFVAW